MNGQNIKVSRGGNVYEKQVRNPIKQVKRQVYIYCPDY